MSTETIDQLVAELKTMKAQTEQIRKRRQQIVKQLGAGRHAGSRVDIMVSAPGRRSRISVERLRRYISDEVLNRCRLYSEAASSVKLVNKPKRTKKS